MIQLMWQNFRSKKQTKPWRGRFQKVLTEFFAELIRKIITIQSQTNRWSGPYRTAWTEQTKSHRSEWFHDQKASIPSNVTRLINWCDFQRCQKLGIFDSSFNKMHPNMGIAKCSSYLESVFLWKDSCFMRANRKFEFSVFLVFIIICACIRTQRLYWTRFNDKSWELDSTESTENQFVFGFQNGCFN